MVELSGCPFLSLSLSLSLSLVKEDFSLGNLRKSPEPITAERQATGGIGGWPGIYTGLPMLCGWNQTSVHPDIQRSQQKL
jgi:hypothetical protein